jgi:hypothetical protein
MSTDHSTPTIEANILKTASNIQLFNSKGTEVRFGDVFANQRSIVVFIRAYFPGSGVHGFHCQSLTLLLSAGHFFCGVRSFVAIGYYI